MTPSAVARAEQGLTGVARKVLDVVPLEESWPKAAIVSALRRAGSCVQGDVVDACLNNLRGRGLIAEPERGEYRRVKARMTLVTIEQEVSRMSPVAAAPAVAPAADPLARFAILAKDIVALAEQLRMKGAEIEDAAIDVGEYLEKVAADTGKLRALQDLLKGIAQ